MGTFLLSAARYCAVRAIPLGHDSTPSSRPNTRFGYALKRAQQAMRTRVDRGLVRLGLNAPRYAVLATLEAEPGLSNADLALGPFVTPQTRQSMLAKLTRAGLIDRRPDETHGRIQRTELTRKGHAVLSQAHTAAAEAERIARDAVAPDDGDAMTAVLDRVADALL